MAALLLDPDSGSVVRFSMATVTLELESPDDPELGENVCCCSSEADVEAAAPADVDGAAVAEGVPVGVGNNLSMSALPNSQPEIIKNITLSYHTLRNFILISTCRQSVFTA